MLDNPTNASRFAHPDPHYIGQRLSFSGELCTVRYVGSVQGTQGTWLGVEWDNTSKGKHEGEHSGVRYFSCKGVSPCSASFIRPTRQSDPRLSFYDALQLKYAPIDRSSAPLEGEVIQISGKTVEKVGFQKIQQHLATLHELRIVILDGLRVAGWSLSPKLETIEWKIEELDLSNTLLETWSDVMEICSKLHFLRILKLAGNRFRDTEAAMRGRHSFQKVKDLSLENTLLSWELITSLAFAFPNLSLLTASSNNINEITIPLRDPGLRALDLSSNNITSIEQLSGLTVSPSLKILNLRSNPLAKLSSLNGNSFANITHLDLTHTLFASLTSLNQIPSVLPSLTHLLTNGTPLSKLESASLHTIARIPTLTELNYSPITPADRQNAEIFYRNTIAKELGAASSPASETAVLASHPRWSALCAQYGEPAIQKADPSASDPGTLAARIAQFTFYRLPPPPPRPPPSPLSTIKDPAPGPPQEENVLIPLTTDIYRLKGIVGRLFDAAPLHCKLVFETEEWDPVACEGGDDGWSVSEDGDDESEIEGGRRSGDGCGVEEGRGRLKGKGRLVRREEELVEGTKAVGDWVVGKKARVRVEVRS